MSAAAQVDVVYPPGCEPDERGFMRYWSDEHDCWMYPVLWNTETGEPIYSLQPKQFDCLLLTPLMRFYGTKGPTNIGFGGAAGGGKSYLARVVATAAGHLWPGSKAIIFRETLDAVKENHVEKFMQEIPAHMYDINLSDLRVTWRANGSSIRFGHLQDERALKKYQGQDYDVMVFEEGTQYAPKLIRWLVGNRLRATVKGSTPFALIPTNPGGVGHYEFKRLFVDRRFHEEKEEDPEDFAFLQSKLDDNRVLIQRDPIYIRKLDRLEEPHRSWLRDGDFAAGAGASFPQLDRRVHMLKGKWFIPPPHWTCFGAFDWGYEHPFSFGYYAANEDGRVFKFMTITGRHLNDHNIAERILDSLRTKGLDPDRLLYVAAGHDCWHEIKAREEHGITTAERFIKMGLPLIKANISRISGVKQIREYLAWQGRALDGGDTEPGFTYLDEPGNWAALEVLETRVPDPDNVEDVLKTDADAFGQGGDDHYDCDRYALMSRPSRPKSPMLEEHVRAFEPSVLAYEADTGRKVKNQPLPHEAGVVHPEFGDLGI